MVTVTVNLPPTFTATQAARREIQSLLELDAHEDLQFVATLLTSELVSNSLRHAGLATDQEISLFIDCSGEALFVEVSDCGPGFNPLEQLRLRAGEPIRHGCMLVNLLADRWGFRRGDRLCCVWFELDLVSGRRSWHGRQPLRGH
jgi:serine/threonine-protein kinase RsbW